MKQTVLALVLGSVAIGTAAGVAMGAGGEREETTMGTMTLNDRELRERLTPEQYRVARENGTEPPFRNEYWDHHEAGLYVDVVSGEPLFASTNKFNSGTGWPSFDRPIDPAAIVEKTDRSLGVARTEVRSRRADSHLGHVFDDGPAPTGRRYCINSASLRFVPVDRLAAEGYADFLPLFGRAAPQADTATFAAGCFWGVEGYFRRVPGVISTEVGYAGGRTENPTYRQVVTGATGHAEAIRIAFDPARVSYETLLKHFLRLHDPTSLNRQGNDVGTQYRSAVFFHSSEQENVARRVLAAAAARYDRPIVTEVARAGAFTSAEEYHQDYLVKNPGGYCHVDLDEATRPLE